jgi:hypothetical protein
MPARIMRSRVSTLRDAGPMVATIFVERMALPPSCRPEAAEGLVKFWT